MDSLCTFFSIKGTTDSLFYTTVHSLMKKAKTWAYDVEHTDVENSIKVKHFMFQNAEAISCVQWHSYSGALSRLNICYLNTVGVVYAICLSTYLHNCRSSAHVMHGPSCALTGQRELYRKYTQYSLHKTVTTWAYSEILYLETSKSVRSHASSFYSPWFLILLWYLFSSSESALYHWQRAPSEA